MFTLEELFKTLSHGPLSNLAMSNDGDGTIATGSQGKLIDYVNEGLLRLYSKFTLSEKELIIRMIEGVTNYYIMARFSQTGHADGSSDPVYIMDALDPFQDDFIKVLRVVGPDGRDLPLNDSENVYSVFTPRVEQLQIPHPIEAATLSVIYQAKHKKLEYGVLSQKIWLPESMAEALRYFVAHKVYSHMNGQENSAKGSEHYAMFQSLIGETVENDLANSSVSNTNTNFDRKGWI